MSASLCLYTDSFGAWRIRPCVGSAMAFRSWRLLPLEHSLEHGSVQIVEFLVPPFPCIPHHPMRPSACLLALRVNAGTAFAFVCELAREIRGLSMSISVHLFCQSLSLPCASVLSKFPSCLTCFFYLLLVFGLMFAAFKIIGKATSCSVMLTTRTRCYTSTNFVDPNWVRC